MGVDPGTIATLDAHPKVVSSEQLQISLNPPSFQETAEVTTDLSSSSTTVTIEVDVEVSPPAVAAAEVTATDPNVEILGVFDKLLAKIALETSQEEGRTLQELGLEGQPEPLRGLP